MINGGAQPELVELANDTQDEVHLQDAFESYKNDKDTLYLPIKQIYFDAIMDRSKKAEYREIKSTTANKYLERDDQQRFIVNEAVANPSTEFFIDDYNGGKFPFVPKRYKRLFIAVGYETVRDMAIVEVNDISFEPHMIRNNLYAFWTVVSHLGEVLEVRRKNTPYTEGDSTGNIAAEDS